MDLKDVRLFIGIPSVRGVQLECMGSIINLVTMAKASGIGDIGWSGTKLPEVGMARGSLAREFLEQTDCTHALFIDDDVQFDPVTVHRMLVRDVPVIGAAYLMKTQDPREVRFVVGVSDEQMRQTPVDGTICVDKLGGGFLMIKREAIAALDTAHRDSRYIWGAVEALGFFTQFVEKGRYQTEDWALSLRWRALGGDLWMMLDAPTVHVSGHHMWPGNFLDVWEQRHRFGSADTILGRRGIEVAPSEVPSVAVAP